MVSDTGWEEQAPASGLSEAHSDTAVAQAALSVCTHSLLSKLFAEIQSSLSSLRGTMQAGASVFRPSDGDTCPGSALSRERSLRSWVFSDKCPGRRAWILILHPSYIFLFYLYKKEGNSGSLIFFFWTGHERKQKLLSIVHKPLPSDDRDGGIPNLSLNLSGSRQFYTRSGIDLQCCQKSHLCPPVLHWHLANHFFPGVVFRRIPLAEWLYAHQRWQKQKVERAGGE